MVRWGSWPGGEKLLCGQEELSSQGSVPGTFFCGDAALCENVSLDTGDQSNEEAKGPGVDSTPFKLFSGENTLNGRLWVRVGACMSSKGSSLRNTAKCRAFCGSLPSASSSRATLWPASECNGFLCCVCNLLCASCVLSPMQDRLFRATLSCSAEKCRKGSLCLVRDGVVQRRKAEPWGR